MIDYLKKFGRGLAFGAGFAVAFTAILMIGLQFIAPKILEESVTGLPIGPEFENPQDAQVITPQAGQERDTRRYRFFQGSNEAGMRIPTGGGILSMVQLPADKESKYPQIYQLWLTETRLWKIRTDGSTVKVEEMPYPKSDPVESLSGHLDQFIRVGYGRSTMTITLHTVEQLKRGGKSGRDAGLNGELRITTEDVVFLHPNPFEN